MSYQEALRYLETFVNYEKLSRYPYQEALNLERVQCFLDLLRNPERSLRFIHVAGTKGKGSTCAFITYILREAGFKTGLYTSPHLEDFRERIRILLPAGQSKKAPSDFEGMISRQKFSALVARLKLAIERYNRISPYGALSFFEICTVLVLVYFKEEKVDFAVLETGLGGRLDATNVVTPLVSVITPLSYEHTDKLGRTLKKIASEKAGIIKGYGIRDTGYVPRNPFPVTRSPIIISALQEEEAMRVILQKCKKEKVRLFAVGRDIKYQGKEDDFNVTTPYGEYGSLRIKLIGGHQLMNAAVALTVVNALSEYGIKVGVDSVRKGLYNTLWPGRCEIIARSPLLVLDGAQNSASAAVLKQAIRQKFRYRKLILILGVSCDKDIKGIAGELGDLADITILTKADNPRAASPYILARYFRKKDKYITDSVDQAMKLAKRLYEKEDLILITGSLFVVGEARHNAL